MPSPALSSILTILLTMTMGAAACAAKSPGYQIPSYDFTARELVLPLQFRIEAQDLSGQRFPILMTEGQSWAGVLETGGQVWMETKRDCPAFETALNAFGRLPSLSPGP